MKTLIAIPCMDTVPYQFTQSMLYLKKGDNISVLMKPNSLVYDSRNLISLTAIENDFDRVMWFDSDMVFGPDTLQRLHQSMDRISCEMITGVYVKRHDGPPVPVLYSVLEEPARTPDGYLAKQITPYMDYPDNEIFPVAGCGFGCCLTSVKLLKAVWDKFGPAFNPYSWGGEDISFCYRVNQLGYQIYCDSGVTCGHIGTKIYTAEERGC